MTRSADGRFEIRVERRDDDSYMYSDSDYTFYVVSVETGDELAQFAGHDYNNAGGRTTWGVETVEIEGTTVVARHYDGAIERLELPSRVAIVDGEWIDVTDAHGNVVRRRRHRGANARAGMR